MVEVRAERKGESWTCAVIVLTEGHENKYEVRVHPADLARWGSGDDAPAVEDLVSRSFGFLLEREPPDSILRAFDLSVIQRYFPEYDRLFKRSPQG
jgi:hypothetical protein